MIHIRDTAIFSRGTAEISRATSRRSPKATAWKISCAATRIHFASPTTFIRWVTATVPYPILFVRYETLWDHVGEIFDFVGIPRAEAASFPGKRENYVERNRKYDGPLARLRIKYARLIAEIEQLPPVLIRPARA